MDDYDGRPHWGKLHYQTAATLRAAVPAVGSVRRGHGPSSIPGGTFRNEYLDRVLGPPVE